MSNFTTNAPPPEALFDEFGSFDYQCQLVPHVICTVLNMTTQSCSPYAATSPQFMMDSLGACILILVAFIFNSFLTGVIYRKTAGVGHKELFVLFLIYDIALVFEFIVRGNLFRGFEVAAAVMAAIHVGLVAAFYICLMCNGFVVFQWVPDGKLHSMGGVIGASFVVFIFVFLVALDTSIGLTNSFTKDNTMALYIITYIYPIIPVTIYLVTQLILMYRVLFDFRPLIFLGHALIFFILGICIQLFLNNKICVGLNGALDGIFFAQLCTSTASFLLFYYFNNITEDDFEI